MTSGKQTIFFTKNGRFLGTAFERGVVETCVGGPAKAFGEGAWIFYPTIGLHRYVCLALREGREG